MAWIIPDGSSAWVRGRGTLAKVPAKGVTLDTIRRRLLFSVIAVAGVLLVLELGARGLQLIAPGLFTVAPAQEGLGPGVSLQPDAELLFRSRPGQWQSGGPGAGQRARHARGAGPPPGSTHGSCSWGTPASLDGARRDDAFPWATGRRLAREGQSFVTLNAGTPGYSSAQSRFQLDKLGPMLDPDIVVIATLWSDMMRTGWRDRELFERFGSPEYARQLRTHETFATSALFVLLRARLLSLRPIPQDQYVLWDTVIGGEGGTGSTRATVADHRANLQAMAQTAEALGAQPVFLVLPANRLGEHPPDSVLQPYQDNFRIVAEAHDTAWVDMDARWKDKDPAELAGLFMDRVHPSAKGHADISAELAPVLGEVLSARTRDR